MKRSIACPLAFLLCAAIGPHSFAQGTLFDQPKRIQLQLDKPESVVDVDWRALVTQAEIRLRVAGFTVRSGTSAEFHKEHEAWTKALEESRTKPTEEARAIGKQYLQANPPAMNVSLNVSLIKSANNERSFVYATSVSVLGSAFIVTPNSALQFELRDGEGKQLAQIPGSDHGHFASVWLFKSSGVFGTNDWKRISDSALSQLDEFINDYLTDNPKK